MYVVVLIVRFTDHSTHLSLRYKFMTISHYDALLIIPGVLGFFYDRKPMSCHFYTNEDIGSFLCLADFGQFV